MTRSRPSPEEGDRRLLDMLGFLPARPFLLRGSEAHMLIGALDAWKESYRQICKTERGAPESPEDAQYDSEALADAHELQQRLYEFLGFQRRPR